MNSALVRIVFLAALVSGAELLAAQRTFVSALNGNDANPCTLSLPCRNFAAAVLQTDERGEVVVLDSGGFGVVAITRSISLIAPANVHAGITAQSGNAIEINAGDTGNVVLRNLHLNSLGTTTNGIDADSVLALHVENCLISEFVLNGIHFNPVTSNARLYVSDSTIRRCKNSGIQIAGVVRATVDAVRLQQNLYGVYFINAEAVIRESVATGGISGFYAQTGARVAIDDTIASDATAGFFAGGGTKMAITRCAVTSNGTGITADGTGTVIYVSDSTIAANGIAHARSGGALIASPTNNTLQENGVNNDFLSHYLLE